MTNLTDLLDPQGDASRVLIRYADRLLVVQHRDHHELLSLDENGATWSDNPTRLWYWHREVAAGHAAAIAGSDAAANEIRAATGYLRRARTQRGLVRMVGAVGPAFLHMQDSEDIPPGLTVCQGGPGPRPALPGMRKRRGRPRCRALAAPRGGSATVDHAQHQRVIRPRSPGRFR